jgi:hypothetical protein
MVKSADQVCEETWLTYETNQGWKNQADDLSKATQHPKSRQEIAVLTPDHFLLLVKL